VGLGAALSLCPPGAIVLVVAGALLCSLYAVPITRGGFRLKAVPGSKSLFVGSAVSIAVVVVPLYCSAESAETDALGVWVFLFVLCTANATAFDVFDFAHDRRARLSTLPVLMGRQATLRATGWAMLASALAATLLEPRLFLPATVSTIGVLCLLRLLPRIRRRSTLELTLDGALLLPLLAQLTT
jgi:4-hydroxybenzoate polyprenyltransferase